MAIACLLELAGPSPSFISFISSRTNSPACVLGDFPSLAASLALSSGFFVGMGGMWGRGVSAGRWGAGVRGGRGGVGAWGRA